MDEISPSHPLPKRNMVIVEFPGNVINDGVALDSFGGEEGLSSALAATGTMLPLRFRPKDPLSHPVFGDYTNTTSLVLKVTTKVSRKSTVEAVHDQGKKRMRADALESTKTEVKTEVVGKVSNMYRFSGLADFQFIDHAGAAKKKRMEAQGAEEDGEEFDLHVDVGKILDEQADEELQLVPPIFSKIDIPQDYSFKQTPNYSLIYTKAADGTSTQRRVALTKRQVKYTVSCRWGQPVPQRMSDLALRDAALLEQHKEGIETLQALFADRPVWSHLALRNTLTAAQQAAFKSLCFVAYTVGNGPFRTLWIRFGYDPRKELGSRFYQLFDFRMPSDVYLRLKDKAPAVAAGGRAGGPQPFRRKVLVAGDTVGGAVMGGKGVEGAGGKDLEEEEGSARKGGEDGDGAGFGQAGMDDHTFTAAPTKMQTLYQLIDITDPYVQSLVQEAQPELHCRERHGWYRKETMAAIGQRLQMRLRALTGIGISGRGQLVLGGMEMAADAGSDSSSHRAAAEEGEEESGGAGEASGGRAALPGEGDGGERGRVESQAEEAVAEGDERQRASVEDGGKGREHGKEADRRERGRAEEVVAQLQGREESSAPSLTRDSSSLRGASLAAVIGSGLGVLAQRVDSGRWVGEEEVQDFDILEGSSSDDEEDGEEDDEDDGDGDDGSGYDS